MSPKTTKTNGFNCFSCFFIEKTFKTNGFNGFLKVPNPQGGQDAFWLGGLRFLENSGLGNSEITRKQLKQIKPLVLNGFST